MKGRKFATAVMFGAMLATGAGCGDNTAPGTDGAGDRSAGGGAQGGTPDCKLLSAAEVTEAIGDHDGGARDYVFGGCVWTAAAPVEGGFVEKIHAAVLPEDHYRQLAEVGEPVDGFGDGATYKSNYGELWFRCGDQWCGIAADIADSDEREQIAIRLGHSLEANR